MSRYLTPQKVSLLVLINLYCESALPASATIPILSFIVSHVISPIHSNARARASHEQPDVSFSIRAFEDVLQGHAASMPGRTLLDVFLHRMWQINSFDALHDLFENLNETLAPAREEAEVPIATDHIVLSRTSPIGVFVRRAKLEYTRLQFHDSMKLWHGFIKYRAPTAQWTRRVAGLASGGIDIVATDMDLRPGDALWDVVYGHLDEEEVDNVISIDDFDRLLEFQLDKLQRLGCRVSDDMRTQLRSMHGPAGLILRSSHLVKFLDTWKAGDYTSAFDNLHRYYDYAMQTREKIHYQYALLHMAILQADFGCFGDAIAAINEAIATARENQDMTCLNFSLSWLNHMSKAYPKQMRNAGYTGMLGSERDGLTFLKAKAKETKMYSLLCATLLNEAKLALGTGDSISRALEYTYQASHLNIREHIGNYGNLMLMQSSLYLRLGVAHMSNAYCELILHCYKTTTPIEEQVRAICRSAFTIAQSGRYDDALALLDSIEPSAHRILKYHQYIYHCTGLIKLKRAIRRTDWPAASSLLTSLTPASTLDPELTFLLTTTRIDYYLSRGHWTEAYNLIEDTAKSLKADNADIFQRVSMLIAKATLWARRGMPERGFSVALRAASVSLKARLGSCLWEAVGLIGNLLNDMGEFEAGSRMLAAVIPMSLENNDPLITGTLYSYLADSYMGLAGKEDISASSSVRARAARVSKAELYIDRAQVYFKHAEHVERQCNMMMKKAVIARLRGDEKLAEEWAEKHGWKIREHIIT